MAIIVDRRIGSSGKSLKNRQRFLDRAKDQIKKTIKDAVEKHGIKEVGKGKGDIKVRSKDLTEPSFRKDYTTGRSDKVLPGNDRYQPGDTIPKPYGGSSNGGNGQGAGKGESEDDFVFTLTREEFQKYLFEDLELPDFIKETLMTTHKTSTQRSGFTNSGSPANLNIGRTFKKSIGRRFALHRPTDEEIQKLKDEIEQAEKKGDAELVKELSEKIEFLLGKQKVVPYIDETDLRYNLWKQEPNPESQAVMFCLMDVSGSMGEIEKDISKRFFLILYLFLESKYEKIDIRFIRHTEVAEEVDEETFFYDRKSGGTEISSGLKCISDIINQEYDPKDWNIYIAQCTDGDNYESDNYVCKQILEEDLLPKTQYYTYIEVSQYDRGGWAAGYSAWPLFSELAETTKKVAAKKIKHKSKVWQVFRSLFSKA